MIKKRVLFVAQEIMPYLPENHMSNICRFLPQKTQESGKEIRTFMPRYGLVNERRNQLHEVIRLSGMNLIINDIDMPLIIKVASIPRERMQVYFIDNEEYFKRKALFTNEDNELFEDNDERAIFFAKGVLETVKKLNWAPDIIHVSGWLASLIPLYLKEYYKNDALFSHSKIVYSVYNEPFEGNLTGDLIKKLQFDNIPEEKLTFLKEPNFNNLSKIAIANSDAVIQGSFSLPLDIVKYLEEFENPILEYKPEEEFAEAYHDFYQNQVLKS